MSSWANKTDGNRLYKVHYIGPVSQEARDPVVSYADVKVISWTSRLVK